MSEIVNINHEVGDLSEYDSTITDGGDLSVTASAALAGTNFGLSCLIDDTTDIVGLKAFTIGPTDPTRFRYYLDPNGVVLTNGERIVNLILRSFLNVEVFSMELRRVSGGYEVRGVFARDGGQSATASVPITDAPHFIEVSIVRSTTAVSLDGEVEFSVDDVLKSRNANLDLFDTDVPAKLEFGASDIIAATPSGVLFLDELVVRDDNQEIGSVKTLAIASAAGAATSASVGRSTHAAVAAAAGAASPNAVGRSTHAAVAAAAGAASSITVGRSTHAAVAAAAGAESPIAVGRSTHAAVAAAAGAAASNATGRSTNEAVAAAAGAAQAAAFSPIQIVRENFKTSEGGAESHKPSRGI